MKENKLKIILCAVLVVILGISYSLFNYLSSATYKAKKYFYAITHNESKEVYDLIDLDDSTLMNLDLLKEKLKKYNNVSDIHIVNEDINDNSAMITFEYTSDEGKNIGAVYLTKKNNNWIINSGAIASNVTFMLPKDSIVTLDNIDIKEYLDKLDSTDSIDVYNIDYMPKGTYNIKVVLKDKTEVNYNIEINNNSNYRLGSIELNENATTKIDATTLELVNNVYNGLINNLSEIEYDKNIVEYYKDLNYDYKKSNYTIKSFKVNDLKELSTTDNNGRLEAKYQIEYEYTITYDGNDYTGLNRDTITIDYDYDGYNLYKIRDLDLRFPIRK